MPRFFGSIREEFATRFSRKDALSTNEFVGFQGNGAVVLRDRRGTLKAEIPNVSEKSETLGNNPLAIYKPSGAKHVDAAKAIGNFSGWTFAAVNAIASEVANIQLGLYQALGDDQRSRTARSNILRSVLRADLRHLTARLVRSRSEAGRQQGLLANVRTITSVGFGRRL